MLHAGSLRRSLVRRVSFVGALVALVAGLTSGARAEDPDGATYGAAIARAMSAHDAGRWLEALAHFEEAHRIAPSARTLRGMGMSAFEASLYARAVCNLEAALVHPARPLSEPLRRKAEVVLREAWQHVASYRVHTVPEDAVLLADGKTPCWGPSGEVLLDVGQHRLEAMAAGFHVYGTELTAQGGHREDLTVLLEPLAPSGPAASDPGPIANPWAEPVPEDKPLATPAIDPWTMRDRGPVPFAASASDAPRATSERAPSARDPLVRSLAIATSAASAAAFTSSIVLYGIGRRRTNEASDQCRDMPAGGCTRAEAELLHAEAHLPELRHALNVTLVLGAVTLVTTTVSWLVHRKRQTALARAAQVDPILRF